MAPTQKELIEKLTAENVELKGLVEKWVEHSQKLTERIEKLEATQEVLGLQQSEELMRIESVEENLCEVRSEQQEIRDDQASVMLRLEGQQMYSRKQTLLVTGEAVKEPMKGEDVRRTVITLLAEYLGVEGLQPQHICACHRLKNPKVILVRFNSLDDTDRVYRSRTKPKKKGILIFESLTAERLSVIRDLKDLKQETGSKILSYYTQTGKIYVRTSEDKGVRPTEIPFGMNKSQIRDLCQGKTVDLSSSEILDRFRSVHHDHKAHAGGPGRGGRGSQTVGGDSRSWVKVGGSRKKPNNQPSVVQKTGASTTNPVPDAHPTPAPSSN